MSPQINLHTLLLFGAGLTFAVPYISAILTQRSYPRWVNETLSLGVSAAAGLISYEESGGSLHNVHSLATLVPVIPAIFAGAKVYYAKLNYSSPLIAQIEWLTGGARKGYPPPSQAVQTSDEVRQSDGTDPAPESSTDSGGSEDLGLPAIDDSPVSQPYAFATSTLPLPASPVAAPPAIFVPVQQTETQTPVDVLPDVSTDMSPAPAAAVAELTTAAALTTFNSHPNPDGPVVVAGPDGGSSHV